MKCLTICNPYPALILTPQTELYPGYVQKRVENRTWSTRYRGLLAIHAGQSHQWMRPEDCVLPLRWGEVVGVVDLVACINLASPVLTPEYRWVKHHAHASGPYCWVLENPRRFRQPIKASGRQGLWEWSPPQYWENLLL